LRVALWGGFGDDDAFRFCGMLPGAMPVALCVWGGGRERSVGRGVGVEIEGGGQRHCLPATGALGARGVVCCLKHMSNSLL